LTFAMPIGALVAYLRLRGWRDQHLSPRPTG
jgi:hypothetical protein